MAEKILEVAWAAGFIDGEGTIGIYKWANRRGEPRYPHPCIQAGNTELEPLNTLKRLFGGSIVISKQPELKRWAIKTRKVCYKWVILHRRCLKAALALVPFLRGGKRKKAFDVINFYKKRQITYLRGPDGKIRGSKVSYDD